jgi:hypothetical protein
MKSFYIIKAIKKLKPTAEFSFNDEDYSTINWVKLEGEAPTQAEIDAAIEQVKADEITEAKAKALAKSALLEKLGITEDEARLLLA